MNLFLGSSDKQHPAYINVRDGELPILKFAKELCLDLWSIYEPFADEHFVNEFQRAFYERFWEMDLTCTLKEYGYSVDCHKPGPDIKIVNNFGSIWIEAVSPSLGQECHADKVPDTKTGVAYDAPENQIKLRFTNAIDVKHKEYLANIRKGIIGKDDPYIIAINGAQIRSGSAACETHIPRIIRTVFPIGNQFIKFDKKTAEIEEVGFEYESWVKKSNGKNIPTDLFLDSSFEGLSGILYSNTDCCNRPQKLAEDYIFVHNPLAINKIPSGYFKFGTEYFADLEEDSFTLRKVLHEV